MSTHLDKYETVAVVVCAKRKGLGHEECYMSRGGGHPPCRGYGKCCLFEKSEEQLDFVLHSLETEAFLKACPGSGKTEVVGLMAAYAMRQRTWKHQGIAVLSFTNNAADVIRDRVSRFAGKTIFPHYVGTFDSWLHGYLLNPYSHFLTGYLGKEGDRSIRLVGVESSANFLNHYRTKKSYGECGPAKANQFFYDLESRTMIFDSNQDAVDVLRNKETISKERMADLVNTKKVFWKSGFATHQDVEVICHQVLIKFHDVAARIAARFPYIVVDECQDLSFGQLRMLESLRGHGSRVHLVGDLNQAIYSFRKVDPERVRQFIDQRKLQVLVLTRNFRSVQAIVDVCGRLRDQGTIQGLPIESKLSTCVYFSYDVHDIAALPSRFEAFAASRGCRIEKTAVVARGRSTLKILSAFDPVMPDNLSKRLALAVHLWQRGDVKHFDNAVNCAGSAVASWCFQNDPRDSRHHDRPEAVRSNIEWRLFLARLLDGCTRHPWIGNLHQTWKAWAEWGRQDLGGVLASCWSGSRSLDPQGVRVRVPSGEGASNVIDTLEPGKPTDGFGLRITTFHQIKGETLDAVLVVSSPTCKSDGGHWLQWVENVPGKDEHARFAYVASSRPKRLLAWAVPEPNEPQRQRLAELGFVPAC